jgi:DNA-nicking Smr family endonuclease
MSGRRGVSDEESALWTGFARSIKPLRRRRASRPDPVPAAAAPAADNPSASPPAAPQPKPPRSAKPPPLAPFERRLKQRVARGREAIDARIDLHGMTQTQAHAKLLRFLRGAQTEGARIVLIVTGKGLGSGATSERGVLRRHVPMWLELPEFRRLVAGFEEAHLVHGGQGALYVRLRRARNN